MTQPLIDDGRPAPVILQPKLPKIPGSEPGKPLAQPTPQAIEFLRWIQRSLASRELKYNETGAVIHFVPEGMALVLPLIFKLCAATLVPEAEIGDTAVQIQREVIKAGWHMGGPNRTNIVRYSVIGRGDVISRLAAVVLVDPGRWVQEPAGGMTATMVGRDQTGPSGSFLDLDKRCNVSYVK